MSMEGLRPIRCQSCGKLICEADGNVVFRCPRCKRRNSAPLPIHRLGTRYRPRVLVVSSGRYRPP